MKRIVACETCTFVSLLLLLFISLFPPLKHLSKKTKDIKWVYIMANQLGSLVESIKSKMMSLKVGRKKKKSPYVKMDKSSSVKVEIRSRQARKLINKTLRAADSPGKSSL